MKYVSIHICQYTYMSVIRHNHTCTLVQSNLINSPFMSSNQAFADGHRTIIGLSQNPKKRHKQIAMALEKGVNAVRLVHSLPSEYWDARSTTTSVAAQNRAKEDLKKSAREEKSRREHERYLARLPKISKGENYYQLGLQRKVINCEEISANRNIRQLREKLENEEHLLKSIKRKRAHNDTLRAKVKETRRVAASLPRVVIPKRRVFVDKTISYSPYVSFEERLALYEASRKQDSVDTRIVEDKIVDKENEENGANQEEEVSKNTEEATMEKATTEIATMEEVDRVEDDDSMDYVAFGVENFEKEWMEMENSNNDIVF